MRITFIVLFLFFAPPFALCVSAEELTPVIDLDEDGKTITITAGDGGEIQSLYIKWDDPVTPYQVRTETGVLECGAYGFLHEFISLPEGSRTVSVILPEQELRLCDDGVRIFSDGMVPGDVQVWKPPCGRADILLIATHADDEILYMGGIAPTYGAELGAQVQVAYMCEFRSSDQSVREHEKLDGLWASGVRNYPVCGNFKDVYCKDYAYAEGQYDYREAVDFLTDTLRRFRPQVVATHDFGGEYGHGFHIMTAKAAAEALECAADGAYRADSDAFREYGSWDVPKAYFHLYEENEIEMDLRVPLSSMGGRTALEVAKEAFSQHVSQQGDRFRVADDYEHSLARFGLYRTKVGYDTTGSMLDNIVLYDDQGKPEGGAAEGSSAQEERENSAGELRESFAWEPRESPAGNKQEGIAQQSKESLPGWLLWTAAATSIFLAAACGWQLRE